MVCVYGRTQFRRDRHGHDKMGAGTLLAASGAALLMLPGARGHSIILFLTHLGMIFFMGVLEWRALLTGRPSPDWTYRRRFPETGDWADLFRALTARFN